MYLSSAVVSKAELHYWKQKEIEYIKHLLMLPLPEPLPISMVKVNSP